jgi:hypothetical protein
LNAHDAFIYIQEKFNTSFGKYVIQIGPKLEVKVIKFACNQKGVNTFAPSFFFNKVMYDGIYCKNTEAIHLISIKIL